MVEKIRFDAKLAALVAVGVDVEDIEHLDVDDVVMSLEAFEALVDGYCAGRARITGVPAGAP